MALEYLKSGSITNLDASPMVVNTSGLGGLARLKAVNGSVSPTTAGTIGSTYQMVRVRSNAVVKHLYVKLDATVTEFDGDVGCYYSTGTNDGTLAANQTSPPTQVNGTTGSQLFGAAQSFDAQNTFVDLCNNVSAANLNKELWSACGLATDPGGFFDITITLTDTTSGSPIVYFEVQIAD